MMTVKEMDEHWMKVDEGESQRIFDRNHNVTYLALEDDDYEVLLITATPKFGKEKTVFGCNNFGRFIRMIRELRALGAEFQQNAPDRDGYTIYDVTPRESG